MPALAPVPVIVDLADAQLRAYNAKDIDAFCACFADDVRVFDAEGGLSLSGAADFRERYGALFADHAILGASILGRVSLPPHLVELEVWYRQKSPESPREQGQVIVRYTERGGLIALVEFLMPS